jgi:hypothetical protein
MTVAGAVASAACASSLAQPANAPSGGGGAKAPQPASAGLVNDWLRDQSPGWRQWDVGGQLRGRFEAKHNISVPGLRPEAVDFRDEGGADNSYWLFREKIHLGYTPATWISAYVEGRDSFSVDDRRKPDPETDHFDLHQAYLRLGDPKRFPVSAKVGRQELAYGDERLVGVFDWSNIGRVFDAAKLRYDNPAFWVEGFTGRVIIPRDGYFNMPNDYDFFSGLYASSVKVVPWQETQLYFFSRNVSGDSPTAFGNNVPPFQRGASPRDIYTLGFRVKSLPGKLKGWDYDADLAGQLGNYHFTTTSPQLEQEAFAAHVAGGYTWAGTAGSPRLGLEYNFSTGDEDPTDGRHQTFDNLFPTNHKYYGFMDFFSWQNIHNLRLNASIKPSKKLTLTADYHAFWLADTQDFFYQVNGAPRATGGYGIKPDAGSYVGSEVDVVATYNLAAYAAIQGGYGHFFTGQYVRDSLRPVGGAADADWFYVQMVFNF